MVVWEETLNKFWNDAAAYDNQNRAVLNERAAVGPADEDVFVVPKWKIEFLIGDVLLVTRALLTTDDDVQTIEDVYCICWYNAVCLLAVMTFWFYGTQSVMSRVIWGMVFGFGLIRQDEVLGYG